MEADRKNLSQSQAELKKQMGEGKIAKSDAKKSSVSNPSLLSEKSSTQRFSHFGLPYEIEVIDEALLQEALAKLGLN